jgi:hypothetical protein
VKAGRLLRLAFAAASVLRCATAGDAPLVAPREAKAGVVCPWHSADGLEYEDFVPTGYDATAGANLTRVLHGNRLDQR